MYRINTSELVRDERERREMRMGETYPKMVISHSNTLSSSTNPAEKPSTGCFLNSIGTKREREREREREVSIYA